MVGFGWYVGWFDRFVFCGGLGFVCLIFICFLVCLACLCVYYICDFSLVLRIAFVRFIWLLFGGLLWDCVILSVLA